MSWVELLVVIIGIPIIVAMAWLVDRKNDYDPLDYFDDDDL